MNRRPRGSAFMVDINMPRAARVARLLLAEPACQPRQTKIMYNLVNSLEAKKLISPFEDALNTSNNLYSCYRAIRELAAVDGLILQQRVSAAP